MSYFRRRKISILGRSIFLIMLLVLLVLITKNLGERKKELLESERVSLSEKGEKIFTPKELLDNKSAYRDKFVSIRAKIYTEPIVCEKRTCPVGKQCCGCPETRDLLAGDFRVSLDKDVIESLKLKGPGEKALCQREENSCNYHCQDWQIGGIYDISGYFSYQPGPTGWNHPIAIYLTVSSKKLLQTIGLLENFGRFKDKMIMFLGSLQNEGSYVMP